MMKSLAFMESMVSEAHRARQTYRKFLSAHESFAVILEEVQEYWELVKTNEPYLSVKYEEELVQIAAMCMCASRELHSPEESDGKAEEGRNPSVKRHVDGRSDT